MCRSPGGWPTGRTALPGVPTGADHRRGRRRSPRHGSAGGPGRGERRCDQPPGRPGPRRGAVCWPECAAAGRTAGGGPAGERAARARRGTARADVRDVRAHQPATDPLGLRWGVPAVPEPPAGYRLLPLRSRQTGRRSGRGPPAGMCPLLRPPATTMRTMRQNPPNRVPRPRWATRYLRRLLQDAAGDLQPLPATPAVLVRYRPEPCLHQMRRARHSCLCALWKRAPAVSPLARGPGV